MWQLHLAMEIPPLLHAVAPIPQFSLWNADYAPELVHHREKDPGSVLSPRELEVARRLATGESRPFIAKSLRISTNAAATTSKRIHAKLGVNNRAAIASLMAQA